MGGITMTKEEWDYLMEECDTNKDGKISREEFLSMMLNPELAKKLVADLEAAEARSNLTLKNPSRISMESGKISQNSNKLSSRKKRHPKSSKHEKK
jgi:hypothetical protein